ALIALFVLFLPRLAAVAAAYVLAVFTHFQLNRRWVFDGARTPAGAQFRRYVLVVAVCWGCTVGVTALALAGLTDNVFLARAAAIPPATVLSFLLMRGFVFRAAKPSDEA
ncbi:MAG TPA: GtrA family protein, partial [Methylomirabilota bacterium]|nr:GtrA family protein [Methylomirabilota bacterium]